MPNYKIASSCKEEITKRVTAEMDKYVGYNELGMPLTVESIQALVAPAPQLAALRELQIQGVQSLPTARAFRFHLAPEDLPGLSRSMLLTVEIPEDILTTRRTAYGATGDATHEWDVVQALRPLEDIVPEQEREALTEWANRVIKARRLRTMVTATVTRALDHMTSTAEVQAGWPMLGTFVEDRQWKARFRNPIKAASLKRHAPQASYMERCGAAMKASEAILMGALMLDPLKEQDRSVPYCANVYRIEKLPSDRY